MNAIPTISFVHCSCMRQTTQALWVKVSRVLTPSNVHLRVYKCAVRVRGTGLCARMGPMVILWVGYKFIDHAWIESSKPTHRNQICPSQINIIQVNMGPHHLKGPRAFMVIPSNYTGIISVGPIHNTRQICNRLYGNDSRNLLPLTHLSLSFYCQPLLSRLRNRPACVELCRSCIRHSGM